MRFIHSLLFFIVWSVSASLPRQTLSKKTLMMVDHPESAKQVETLKETHNILSHNSLEILVSAAHSYFSHVISTTRQTTKPQLVIFDIDDTAIKWVRNQPPPKRRLLAQMAYAPLKPILDLYQKLLLLNFKIAFVTWRIDTPARRRATEQHLKHSGYHTYESLHMRPEGWKQSRSECKQAARKLLAESYSIVATVDDILDNLEGEHTGNYVIWVNQS